MRSEGRYRYPQINFFTSNDEDIFCGRTEDAQRLFSRLMLSNTLVLHGESGTGKTSLVQAGLLPRIFSYNQQQQKAESRQKEKQSPAGGPPAKEVLFYLPVIVRLDEVSSNHGILNKDQGLLRHTLSKIAVHKNEAAERLPFIGVHENSLWYAVKCLERNNRTLLLIFDQFEELQTYAYAEAERFVKHLADLFVSPMPEAVYEEYEAKTTAFSGANMSEEERAAYSENIRFLEQPLRVKILFVVREDKLGTMSLLSDYFPNILKNDFLLLPLTIENARRAIAEPAQRPGTFLSPRFKFAPPAVAFLLENLVDTDTGLYDPIQLQIVCSNIERKTAQKDQQIEVGDLPAVGDTINDFYADVWQSVKGETTPAAYDALRKRIIEKLVVGGKRNLVHESLLVENDSQADKDTIAHLAKEGLLKKIPGKEPFYQLTHDRMVPPLIADLLELEAKEKARKRVEEDMREEALRKKVEADMREAALRKATQQKRAWIMASGILLFTVTFAVYYALIASSRKKQAEEDKYLVTSTVLKLQKNPTMAYLVARNWYNRHKDADSMGNYLRNFGSGIFLSGVYPSLSGIGWAELANGNRLLVAGGEKDSMIWEAGKSVPQWRTTENSGWIKSIATNAGRIDFLDRPGIGGLDSVEVRDDKGLLLLKVPSNGWDFAAEAAVAVSPDKRYAVVEDRLYSARPAKAVVRLPSSVRTQFDYEDRQRNGTDRLISAAFLNRSEQLVAGYESGRIVLFGIKEEKNKLSVSPTDTLSPFSLSEDVPQALAVDATDKYVFSAQKKGGVSVWTISPNTRKTAVPFGTHDVRKLNYSGTVNSMAVSSNNKLLLTGSSDGTIGVWSIPEMEPVQLLKWPPAKEIRSVSFAGNKDILAVTEDNIILHWKMGSPSQLYDGNELYRFSPFNYAVLGLNAAENRDTQDTASTEALFNFTLNCLLNLPADNEFRKDADYTDELKNASTEIKALFERLHQKQDYGQKVSPFNDVLLDNFYYRFLQTQPASFLYADSLSGLARGKLEARDLIADWKEYFSDTADRQQLYIKNRAIYKVQQTAAAFIEKESNYGDGINYLTFYVDSVLSPFLKRYPKNSLLAAAQRNVYYDLFRCYLFSGNYAKAKEYAGKTKSTTGPLQGSDSLYVIAVYLAEGNEDGAANLYMRVKDQRMVSFGIRRNFSSLLNLMEKKNVNAAAVRRFGKRFALGEGGF